MNELIVYCPSCKADIRLTESLAAPLLEKTRQHYDGIIAKKEADAAKQRADLQKQKLELVEAKANIDAEVTSKLMAERHKIAAEEARKARMDAAASLKAKSQELTELTEILKKKDMKLAEAQQAQAELIRKSRELDDARREMALTIERRIQEALDDVRLKARKEAEESLHLQILEKETLISSMQRKIQELKQKAEQGSQQLQGEVQELELEASLSAAFPTDKFVPVAKGESGADLLQQVSGLNGRTAGTILWECKRTKSWSDGWLPKLRQDQRHVKADVAIIVSQAVPKHVESFDHVDGVWIATSRCAVPVATALRYALIENSSVRAATDGQHGKMEQIYSYLTGPLFRQRVQAIVEKFTDMSDDLEKERRAVTRMWAKRDQQIRTVIDYTAGLYGDIQGIAGQSLKEIEGLDLQLPEAESGA